MVSCALRGYWTRPAADGAPAYRHRLGLHAADPHTWWRRRPLPPNPNGRESGWLGEVAAIETTMAAAAQKLQAMRDQASREAAVHLGMPDVRRTTARSSLDR